MLRMAVATRDRELPLTCSLDLAEAALGVLREVLGNAARVARCLFHHSWLDVVQAGEEVIRIAAVALAPGEHDALLAEIRELRDGPAHGAPTQLRRGVEGLQS